MILYFMKKGGTYGKEKYSKGELAQLARRKMVQKDHGDDSKYTRKSKHKKDWEDYDNWYPDSSF